MRRLFWRIFAAIWLANVAIIVCVAWVTWANFESEQIPGLGVTRLQAAMDDQLQRIARSGWRRGSRNPSNRNPNATADADDALERSLRVASSHGPVVFYAIDTAGQDLIGRPVPVGVRAAARADTAADPPERMRKRTMTLRSGEQLTLIANVEGSTFTRVLYRRSSAFWSQFGIAIIISALVSALLAWTIVIPLNRIRRSTRRFAEGDLDARVGSLSFGRSYEMMALACEFDRMAERIKGLIDNNRRLVRDVSHELRSPLARLRVAVELAREDDAELTRKSLDRIEREANRLDSMLSQAIELSRLETNVAPRSERIDLVALLEDVIASADYEGAPRGRRVEFVERNDAAVIGSREAIFSALENIVRNALAYTADHSSIEVRLSQDRNEAVIGVRDHGPGVAEAELQRILEPFYRTDTARARSSGGTGLGLAIAKSAIAKHGGSLRASNAQGGGLHVQVRLPLEVS